MISSRAILIILGIILLLIVIIGGNRATRGIREQLGRFLPSANTTRTPTPTPRISLSPAPTTAQVQGTTTKGGQVIKEGTPTNTIPSTGPANFLIPLLGGGFSVGFLLRSLSKRKK